MQRYEYKVVPAPARGEKAKGIKNTDARFAHALTGLLNALGADGWEYLRAETLPCEERTGLIRSLKVTQQHLLVFRRNIETEDAPYAVATDTPLRLAPDENPQAPGPIPAPNTVPTLRPMHAGGIGAAPSFAAGTGLRATHDADVPRRVVPLGAPGDGRDSSRG